MYWVAKKESWLSLLLLSGSFCASVSAKGKVHPTYSESVSLRDPFWPVGYKATPVEESSGVQKKKVLLGKDWVEAQKLVVINGVSKVSDGYLAIINTEAKAVGELVTINYGGMRYSWRVESVTSDGKVKLKRISAEKVQD